MRAEHVHSDTIREWVDADYETLVATGEVEFVHARAPAANGIENRWRAELEARAWIDGLRLMMMVRWSTPVMQLARKNVSTEKPTSYSDYELSVLPRAQHPKAYRELVEREWASELVAARERLDVEAAPVAVSPKTWRSRFSR